jgi:cell division protease FtsH
MAEKIKRPPAQNPFGWRNIIWILAIWFLFAYLFGNFTQRPQTNEKLSYTAFKESIRKGKVSEVTIRGQAVHGQFKAAARQTPQKTSPDSEPVEGGAASTKNFATTLPSVQDPNLLPLLEKNDVTIQAGTEEQPWFLRMLISLLPWLLIIGFFVYSSKKFQERMGGRGGGIFGFGKSKARLYDRTSSDVTFKDIAGLTNAKKELQEVVAFLKEPSKFTVLGGELPHGLLLVGPPGVGKTLMARAAAGEADVPF